VLSGKIENVPYSLSRWTDVPAAKWSWFREQLKQGWMVAFDQRTSLPDRWSLKPEDTLGLIFWTKDPTNLVKDAKLLYGHRVKIHMTMTGWHEVEKGAPSLLDGLELLKRTADTFMKWNVTWRFSPVPLLPAEVLYDRFDKIAEGAAEVGIERVLVSFLQPNDLMPETRSKEERVLLLERLGEIGKYHNINVQLCNEDRLLEGRQLAWVESGVCAPPEDFAIEGAAVAPAEGCGCVMAVDPFTINESCTFGCQYCYAADKSLSPKKRNTTRGLPVVQR
jgi:DNA repair photolyase